MNPYTIQFSGLKRGKHNFEFKIDDAFFSNFEHSIINKSNLSVELVFDKKDNMFILDFDISGQVTVECDRCLDPVNIAVEAENKLIVKFGENDSEEDDIIVISPTDYELNVSQYIYEYAHLALPLRLVHEDDENGNSDCNPEILDKLNQIDIDNQADNQQVDERWSALKGLFDKN